MILFHVMNLLLFIEGGGIVNKMPGNWRHTEVTFCFSALVQKGSASFQKEKLFLEKSKEAFTSGAQKLLATMPWFSSHMPVDIVRWFGHVFVMKALIRPANEKTIS